MLKPLTNLEVTEKQTATFECEFSKPKQTAKWFQKGDEITAEWARFHPEVEGTVHRLVINDTQMDDADKYRCVIKDKQTSAKLTVLGKLMLKMKVKCGSCFNNKFGFMIDKRIMYSGTLH